MKYVIGVDGGSTKYLIKATDLEGNVLAQRIGPTTNHILIGTPLASQRVKNIFGDLLNDFGGIKEDCKCICVGAAGIDSMESKITVESFYQDLGFHCPLFCLNDGTVALYAATKGLGMVAISGTGSIVVGRNAEGKTTRSGGHSITIMGEEGSSRWISIMALRHMSKWVDESVPMSPLVQHLIDHFNGFDANKLVGCTTNLYKKSIDSSLAVLVYKAAQEGDEAAISILLNGARELFEVAQTVVKKLGFEQADHFYSGVWGSVFCNNHFFLDEYTRLFAEHYPNAEIIMPAMDAADGAAALALDYLQGKVPFIMDLI